MNTILQQEDEAIAAKAVADIGVAFLYASVSGSNDIQIERVLGRRFTSYAELNPSDELELANTPYLLEVHFSADHSRFILIARPRSSFWPAFLFKMLSNQKRKQEAIILDSNEMVLRKTNALTPFDKFFEKYPFLDRYNATEMTKLVETAAIFPLYTLALDEAEFTPLDIPGSYRLYNLPRYYLFSETLSKNSTDKFFKLPQVALISTKGSKELQKNAISMQQQGLSAPLFQMEFMPYEASAFQIKSFFSEN